MFKGMCIVSGFYKLCTALPAVGAIGPTSKCMRSVTSRPDLRPNSNNSLFVIPPLHALPSSLPPTAVSLEAVVRP